MSNILKAARFPDLGRPLPNAEVSTPKGRRGTRCVYRARWLELADAARSATDKAAKALELARHEQERIRRDIKRRLDNYAKAGGRRVKKIA